LSDIEAGVAEEFREGDHVTTIKDPLFGEGVAVAMNPGSFYSPALVVVIESGVAGAFGKLLTVDVAEKEVLIGLVLSVFQVFA
jgi:hypothetical protein